MLDKWCRRLDLKMSMDKFERLPINSFYKYEYWDGAAHLSPRPKFHSAILPLRHGIAFPDDTSFLADGHRCVEVHHQRLRVRPLADSDWPELPELFAAAFHRVLPFQSLKKGERLKAADDCLEYTRQGGDGPVIWSACRVAEMERTEGDRVYGAALVTLFCIDEAHDWLVPWRKAPDDAVAERRGIPHLTWIFVAPLWIDEGLGTALLAEVVEELLRLGYASMCSTFLRGNDASLLWHWRNGFQLRPDMMSRRVMNRRIEDRLRASATNAQKQPSITQTSADND